jgi:hypothetical protein
VEHVNSGSLLSLILSPLKDEMLGVDQERGDETNVTLGKIYFREKKVWNQRRGGEVHRSPLQ